jgi:hypothetical protein
MIPNILHFVFGMAADFGGKPFSLVHYLAIKSAVELNRPTAVYFHYQYEPAGAYWQRAKDLVIVNKVSAPDFFMGRPLYHVAHKADVIRLLMLREMGGIYLDLDTISVKPLTDFLNCSFAIGEELKIPAVPKNWRQKIRYTIRRRAGVTDSDESGITGLCNAVLLSEKNSSFVNLWIDEYQSFRSKGRDKFWNEHSVKVPEKLASLFPAIVTKLNPSTFYYPLYDKAGLQSMFEDSIEFPGAYLHHLWESFSWNPYLARLSEVEIKNHDSTYNLIARKYL